MHKVYINLLSHKYQRQGRYPAAGEIVSAESRNTGLGIARLARARGEGFQRAGQAAGVSGVGMVELHILLNRGKIFTRKLIKRRSS